MTSTEPIWYQNPGNQVQQKNCHQDIFFENCLAPAVPIFLDVQFFLPDFNSFFLFLFLAALAENS